MKRTFWIGLVVVIALGLGIFGFVHRANAPSADTLTNQMQATTVTYQGEAGKNALELLKAHATVETATDPSLGEYVTSVNSVKGGTDGKYWIFYVNGQAASMGADKYVTLPTDTIDWKFE